MFPKPKSSRRRLVTGDVQVNCCERPPIVCRYPPISGEVVPDNPRTPSGPMAAAAVDWRHPGTLVLCVAPLHGSCSFQWKLNLLRGVACRVRRTVPTCQLSAPSTSRVVSGTYRNLVGLPAFTLG